MIDYLERRFRRFAIPNITAILITGQVLLFALIMRDPDVWIRSALIPNEVLNGEYWRLITFLFLPPGSNPLWAFFFWYLFYLMGTALEVFWGTFRFNVFLLIGYLAIVASSFILPDGIYTNQFAQGTVFLAFAYLNPTFQLRLMFILPIQIRWLAMLTWFGYSIGFIWGDSVTRLRIGAAVLNFFVFFGPDVYRRMVSGQRFMASQAKRIGVREPDYFHICAVCGLTDKQDSKMDFRYCSKCSGDLAYCSEHLRDHDHILDDDAGSK